MLLALVLAVTGVNARARQDPTKPGSEGTPAAPAGQEGQAEGESIATQPLPPSAYVDGERPPAKVKLYDARRSKVWAAVLDALKGVDAPIETSDEKSGAVQTKLIAFQGPSFRDVATAPPTLTKERPIRQPIRLSEGWYSIEIHVASVKGGTQVEARAYIEGLGHDLPNARGIHVERFSNGKIEDYIFAKIDEALK